METKELNINKLHQGLKNKEFSAMEIAKFFLENIKLQDKKIGAFLEVSEELALEQAKKVDDLIAQGREIPVLAGVPGAIKDNILVKGLKCTAASKILENYQAPYDATCIKKLKKEGVLILGKTNLDEFAMGASTEHSAFKTTRNPIDLNRVPGGSSGGSAAAVKAGEALFSLGSDTGGSIRQPASFCGVVGFKPTYGAVSRSGLIAFASSLDQIGPFARSVEDAERVFNVICGKDELDSTSINLNPKSQIQNPIRQLADKIQNLRIGVPKEYFGEGIDKGVREVIEKAIERIEKEGVKIEEISLPNTKYALACYYIICTSEASANLARYDGIRFGQSPVNSEIKNPAFAKASAGRQKSKVKNLLDVYLTTREDWFGGEVKRRIMLGTYALSAGYYEAYYLRAQKVRTLVKRDFENAFQKIDFILTPVSPFPAFKIGEKLDDPLKMYLADVFTVSVNLAGLPGLSMPCGKVGDLPVGLQIIGKPFSDSDIFFVGKTLEKIFSI